MKTKTKDKNVDNAEVEYEPLDRLDGLTTYLVGPIDDVKDDGVGWRQEITPHLKEMGVTVFDPTDKPSDLGREVGPEKDRLMKLKEAGDWASLREAMKPIVHIDLRMTQKSDFIVAYLPKNAKVCGTIHEIVLAVQSKIPVLILCPGGRKTVSNWLFGIVHYNYMHESMTSLIEHLNNIHSGVATVDKSHWQFFDYTLLEEAE